MYPLFAIEDKTVLVTGGFGLIGSELVVSLLKANAHVVVLDINHDDEKLARFRAVSPKVVYKSCDITQVDAVADTLEAVRNEYDTVDALVNNAYPKNPHFGRPFEKIELKDWHENLNLHLGGYFNITQQVSRYMKEQKSGAIVNLGSIYGMVGPRFSIYQDTKMTMPAEYAAIKGGIINFTRYLATYLATWNVRVNSVSPGGVFDHQDERFVKRYEEQVPLGRMATPEDVCGLILFLISPAARYITGQNIAVDGGWTAW